MAPARPFRILSNAEFQALSRHDKLGYLASAIEAHKTLTAQLSQRESSMAQANPSAEPASLPAWQA
jgi:hypothetical protein